MAVSTQKELRNQVIYQVFCRNYGDGTLRGLTADLPRIRALGVDWVYLLPVQPSGRKNRKGSAGSPYAISDYRTVDPQLGTMEDFSTLCDAAHGLGMKVMLDVVYNHTSPDSVLAAEHPQWFYHKPDGSFGNRIGDWWDVIDLDYSHKALWDYQIETLKLWARHVDGFRCDVAPLIPLDFWMRARAEVNTVRPGCVWLAESVEPEFIRFCRSQGIAMASDGELYQAFDILYDYDIYRSMVGTMSGKNSLQAYLEHVNSQETMYPDNFCKLRNLENHDRPRAAAWIADEQALRNWTAWNYFATGTVMLYAGEEYCVAHHPSLFDPDPVQFATGRDISKLLRALADLKRDAIFAHGTMQAHAAGRDGSVILAQRSTEGRICFGIFATNGGKHTLEVDLPDGTYRNAIDGTPVDVYEKTVTCSGEPIIVFAEKAE